MYIYFVLSSLWTIFAFRFSRPNEWWWNWIFILGYKGIWIQKGGRNLICKFFCKILLHPKINPGSAPACLIPNILQPAFDFTTIFHTGSFHYKLQKTFQKKKRKWKERIVIFWKTCFVYIKFLLHLSIR